MQDVNFIPEGDMCRLVANSKPPKAEKFESWIFDEVLTSPIHYSGQGVSAENKTTSARVPFLSFYPALS